MARIGWKDIFCLCICLSVHLIYRYRRKRPIPFPPGPSRWPIAGNAFQIPWGRLYAYFEEVGTQYGSKIVYMEAFGLPIIAINDVDIANDLLDKRSAIYSSRPRSVMFHDVIKADKFFSFMEYGNDWKNLRRIFKQHFSSKHLDRDQEILLPCLHEFLLPSIYENPEKIDEHIKSYVGAVSLSLTYGLPVERTNDPSIKDLTTFFQSLNSSASGDKYFVNVIPALRYIPEWMPGAAFKSDARKIRTELDRLLNEPYNKVLKNMMEGTAPTSFVSSSVEKYKNLPNFENQETNIKHVALQTFGAAFETTVASIRIFILAMLMHPEIQKKAQDELDSVVGHDQLPDFSDREKLPYLTAILKESLRWIPVLPAGVPHFTTADDVYNGYFIPKGSMVMPNAHAMLHNSAMFPDPDKFIPERFINEGALRTDILDPFEVATFGFGRRICPGSHVANAMLYITAASILALFDIKPTLDASGKPTNLKSDFLTSSIIAELCRLECQIALREGRTIESLLQGYLTFFNKFAPAV